MNKIIFGCFSVIAACLMLAGCGSGQSGQQCLSDGIEAYKARNFSESAAKLAKASELIPNSVEACTLLGSSYLQLGDLAKATDAYKEALSYKPGHGEALAGLGEIAFHEQKFDEAQRYFRQAYNTDLATPESRAAVLNGIARVEYSKHNYPQYRLHLLNAQKIDSKYAPTYYNLGTLYRDQYRLFEEAIDQFSLFRVLCDKNDPYYGKAEQKIKQLEGMIARNARPAEKPDAASKAKADKLIEMGSEALATRKYNEAIKHFKSAINSYAGSFNAQFGLGVAYTRQGLKAEALEAFQRASRLQPTHQDCYLRAATLAIQLKRYKDAEAILNKAIARSPFSPETLKQIASLYHLQQKIPEARAYGNFYLSLLKSGSKDETFEKWLKSL